MHKKYDFMAYDEIPFVLKRYVLTVAAKDDITELGLQDINDFLNEVEGPSEEPLRVAG